MNLACPVCGRDAVTVLQKIVSSEMMPVQCRNCEVLLTSDRGFLVDLAAEGVKQGLVFGSLLAAWLLSAWWIFIAGIAAAAVAPVAWNWRTSLKVVTRR